MMCTLPRVVRFGRRVRKDKGGLPQREDERDMKKRKTSSSIDDSIVDNDSDEDAILSEASVNNVNNRGDIDGWSEVHQRNLITPSRDSMVNDDEGFQIDADVCADDAGVRAASVSPEEIAPTPIVDTLFSRTALYKLAKPFVEELKQMLNILIGIDIFGSSISGSKWGQSRTDQFVNHVFSRRSTFKVTDEESTGMMDTKIVDSAVKYLSSLQSGGTNFTENEFVRQHILEALVISDVSIRAVATRLGVNRKVLPSIVQKRSTYDKICAAKSCSSSTSPQHDDDQSLEAMQDSFAGGRGSEELGRHYLFAALQIDPDDDYFFDDDSISE